MAKKAEVQVLGSCFIGVWKDLAMNEEGDPQPALDYRFKTFQVSGDPSGAKVEIRGNIIPEEFEPMTDYSGLGMLSYGGFLTTQCDVREIKPCVVGGDEKTKLTVAMILRR